MNLINDDKSFKFELMSYDLQGGQSAEEFAVVCSGVAGSMSPNGIGEDFRTAYRRLLGTPEALMQQVENDMRDNYVIGAFVCMEMGIPKDWPLIAWAALNKMEFKGLHGEIACIRALMWAGFDVNAQTSRGISALHAMCNLKWGQGAHPRAISHLIENGANVNLRSAAGDTPLITLCGHTEWSDDIDHSCRMLLDAGADMEIEADDGTSAWVLIQKLQKQFPDPMRRLLIDELAG